MTETGSLTPIQYSGTGTFTCSKCRTVHRHARYMVEACGDMVGDATFKCPICKTHTSVSPDKIEFSD